MHTHAEAAIHVLHIVRTDSTDTVLHSRTTWQLPIFQISYTQDKWLTIQLGLADLLCFSRTDQGIGSIFCLCWPARAASCVFGSARLKQLGLICKTQQSWQVLISLLRSALLLLRKKDDKQFASTVRRSPLQPAYCESWSKI